MEKIRESIVVEGRDDVSAVLRAVEADVIPTHGYGISRETLKRIRAAFDKRNIIIFTDPDHAGNCIRKKLAKEFPGALQAFLPRRKAEKGGDIGIENAAPEDIIKALKAAGRSLAEPPEDAPSESDLIALGLSGSPSSMEKREKVGGALGIGGGNAGAFLKKLRRTGIKRSELFEAAKRAEEER